MDFTQLIHKCSNLSLLVHSNSMLNWPSQKLPLVTTVCRRGLIKSRNVAGDLHLQLPFGFGSKQIMRVPNVEVC